MKVIVFAHRLEIGGTQVNAIDLAAELRSRHGVEPIIFATPGPACELIEDRGLRFEPAPDARFHPSMRRIKALRALVEREHAELIHAWDWWQCLEAYYGVHLPSATPLIVTDMMMELTRILPRSIPSTFGTPEVLEKARDKGYERANLLLPPVDTILNAPGAIDSNNFRRQLDIGPAEILVITVSRLSDHLKGESLLRTIAAVEALEHDIPVRLVVVGEGQARQRLEAEASGVNERLGREAVLLVGELADPRVAYDAADIVVGMGGSALRGAAFGKPVVVVGESGFSKLLTTESNDWLHYHGMYGLGDGDMGNVNLVSLLRDLATNENKRLDAGRFARKFAVENFSLAVAGEMLASYYRDALAEHKGTRSLIELARTSAIYLRERRFLTPSRDRIVKDEQESLGPANTE